MAPQHERAGQGGGVEVVLTLSDLDYPFVRISEVAACRVELCKLLPGDEGDVVEYFAVTGADPDRVRDLARDAERVDSELLARHDDGGLFEFVVGEDCPVRELVTRGALPRAAVGDHGDGRIVAEIPADREVGAVLGPFLDAHGSATLQSKRSVDSLTSLFTADELTRALDDRLTDRQQEVLWTAYEAGYYERPREKSGQEIADELGISPATFSEHIRMAMRRVVSLLDDDERR